jgi:hypothetical protein
MVNGFPVIVQVRGAALRTVPGRRACGWARPGPAKAPQEMNDPAASRGGPAALAVAREFRPGTGWGRPGCRETADASASGQTRARRRGQGSRRARCPGGAELAVLPGLEPHRGGLPAAGAGDSGDAVAGQAAGRQQTAQQAADDVRELPRNASPGPAWRRCHLPGARPGRRRAPRPGRRPANRQAALCPMSVPARLRARAARGCLRWRAASLAACTRAGRRVNGGSCCLPGAGAADRRAS